MRRFRNPKDSVPFPKSNQRCGRSKDPISKIRCRFHRSNQRCGRLISKICHFQRLKQRCGGFKYSKDIVRVSPFPKIRIEVRFEGEKSLLKPALSRKQVARTPQHTKHRRPLHLAYCATSHIDPSPTVVRSSLARLLLAILVVIKGILGGDCTASRQSNGTQWNDIESTSGFLFGRHPSVTPNILAGSLGRCDLSGYPGHKATASLFRRCDGGRGRPSCFLSCSGSVGLSPRHDSTARHHCAFLLVVHTRGARGDTIRMMRGGRSVQSIVMLNGQVIQAVPSLLKG